jgi:two-component system, sensor histidine kinase and response regulator
MAENRDHSGKQRSLWASLIWMVLACVVPAWVGLAILMLNMLSSERERAVQNEVMTARALVLALDRYLASAQSALEVLARSRELEVDDFAGFHRLANDVIHRIPGNNIVLRDEHGQQLVNTLKPFGERLPLEPDSGALKRVFLTGKPTISDLFFAQVAQQPIIAVEVPVFRDGKVKYSISIGIFAERLRSLLTDQALPPGWVATIYDSKGVIVARTQNQDAFVGKPPKPELGALLAQRSTGFLRTVTREGIPVYGGVASSAVSNWAVAIGAPAAEMDRPIYTFLGIVGTGGVLILVLVVGVAGFKSRQIVSDVKALIKPAMAFGRGETPVVPQLRHREMSHLGAQLESAFRLLQLRTRERDRAENERKAAERAAQLKDEFIATVSHELRTPLTSIAVSLELLAEDEDIHRSAETSELVAIARGNGERLVRLINDILDIEKLETGKMTFDIRPLDLPSLLEKALENNRPMAESFHTTLRLEVKSERSVVGDANRLMQVLTNLISNACKFSPLGGEALITSEDRDGTVRVSVRDQGPGIPEEFRHRIFEKFAQADNSDAREKNGAGLGLSIVKEIVHRLGGEIHFADAPGGGTVFFFDLAVADDCDGHDTNAPAASPESEAA